MHTAYAVGDWRITLCCRHVTVTALAVFRGTTGLEDKGRKLHGPSNHVFWCITSMKSYDRADFQQKPGPRVYSWPKESCMRWYYGIDGDLLKHIRTHIPHRTISDICKRLEHRFKSDALIDDNNGETGWCTLLYNSYFLEKIDGKF